MTEETTAAAKELSAFDDACNNLIAGNFLTSQSKVSAVLKTIAASRTLYGIMEAATAQYDFEQEFVKSKVPTGTDGYVLHVPTDKFAFIAYAFGVLLGIDLDAIDFSGLLSDYFHDFDEGINGSYKRFCLEIVDKFRRSVLSVADGAFEEEAKAEAAEPSSPFAPPEILNEIDEYISRCINYLLNKPDLSLRDKDEMLVVCDCLSKSAKGRNKSMTLALYVGLKYALKEFSEMTGSVESIGNLLAKNGII